jgi:phenylacetate-CoA ligase
MEMLKDKLLAGYHLLPYPFKVLTASLRGFYLRSWRYGPETERLVEEALSRESWSLEQWRTWQQEKLGAALHRAATAVPYYRDYWEKRRRRGDQTAWEYLENWPILEKESLRSNPRAFVADDCNLKHLLEVHTSGTSGKPLTLWRGYATEIAYYALFEARFRRWYGVSRHDRWAILGGQLVAPVERRRPPCWVWNWGLNQLYMSSYHLSPDLIPYYFDALTSYRITYLWGYSSSLYALALEAGRSRRRLPSLAVVIANAEPLFPYQRQAIARAFQCPVRETYGMAENVAAASECQAGRLHLWPEMGLVEVLEAGRPVAPGNVGDLVCTGLLNMDMPLIRYRVGDRGALPRLEAPCPCGRGLPVLGRVEGRVDDILYTADGGRVGRLDPVFKVDFPIQEAQIIQETLTQIRVRYVPAPDYTTAAGDSIVKQLQARLGTVQVILEPVQEIPREPNGKFRAVICALPAKNAAAP